MGRSFKLPDLGEGIHEAEVLNVLVSPGDHVEEGDPIIEVETDKASVEIPSPFTGGIEEIKVGAGDTVQVGDVLMIFGEIEEAEPSGKTPPEREEKEKEAGKSEEKAKERPEPEPEKVEEEKTSEEAAQKEKAPEKRKEGPVPASPATRRLARELNVDLHEVQPGGPGGRVTSEDVRAFADRGEREKPEEKAPPEREERPSARPIEGQAPELPDFTRWGEVERVPVRSIRRATAKKMALAWSQIPHVFNQDMVDMTSLEEFRQKRKEEVERRGGRLSITVFALKAAVTALKKHERFNASLDTAAGEMVIKHYYHIGVAVSTEEGLVVPVIRDVDRKSIVDLSIELNDLVRRAREREVKLEEMQGATFTITNVGPMGGGYFAPIINFPEVSILGMGAARMQPMVQEKEAGYEIVPRLMMPVVLSIDHRILDGADALKFMKTLVDSLEDPEEMFITMS
ncbi:MAG: dihydrolipoamide acetyltransferase family protein [Desulfatiglandales bacterium]